jgi:hypothetical protein
MRRLTLIALPLLCAAAPMAAHAQTDVDDRAAAILNDPVQQDRLADTVAELMDAVLQVNVGPLAKVIAKADPASDAYQIPSNATLGGIVSTDRLDGRAVGDQVRSGARMAGAAASVLGAYMPVLKEMARDVAAQVERNVRDAAK